MYYKVKIKKMPKARTGYQVDGSLANDVASFGGADYRNMGVPDMELSKYITAVPREEANLEAEGGETVYGDLNGDNFPEHKVIKGPRHSEGGVPLKLPEDSFIFSDTNSMKLNNPNILQMFNKTHKKGKGSKGYTPATLAKQYDIDKYRKILQDPNSDAIARKTAELMIRNYNMKLGALALAQESKKGFPQGIPVMAKPYLEANGIQEEQLLPPELPEPQAPQPQMQQQAPMPEDIYASEEDAMMDEEMMAQQMMGQEQQQMMPQMAMYGMQMGGYDLPFAQDGFVVSNPDGTPVNVDPNYVAPSIPYIPEDLLPIYNLYNSPNEMQSMSQEEIDAWTKAYPEPEPERTTGPQQQYGGISMADYGMDMGGYDMPFAQYGMAMGANPMDYMGDASQFYEDGGELETYPVGGEPPKGQIVKRSDYADEAAYQLALKKAYMKSQKDGQKIYTLKPDGSYVEMKSEYKAPASYTGDATSWNNKSDVAGRYYAMETALKDPATAKLFADATRKALVNQESYKGKKGTYSKNWQDRGYGDPSQLSDEEIVKNFLEHQERNLKLAASGNESFLYKDANGQLRSFESSGNKQGDNLGFKDLMKQLKKPDGSAYTDAEIQAKFNEMQSSVPTLDKAFEKIGLQMPAVAKGTPAEKKALLQQATFQGYNQLVKDFNAGKITNEDDAVRLMNFRGNLQRGYTDETGQAVVDISPIDAYYTNTTAGQISNFEDLAFSEIPPEKQPCPCTDDSGKVVERDKDGNCPCPETKKCPCGYDPVTKECKPCEKTPPKSTNWWLQDTIKTAGAFGDLMGLNKYMPYSPMVDLEEPRPTFLDPTRELAQQSEQANIATQSLAQFAGPQALSARASSIQGTGAKQAADTLARFNNANVNLADQFEFKSVDVRNQERLANQAAQSKLYDQNTIANQQFDNAKLAMRNQVRNYYTNAITNRGKTAALNALYPQYSVLPETGGMPGFEFGKKAKPSTGSKTEEDYYEEYIQKGYEPTIALKLAQDMAKRSSGSPDNEALDVINAQYSVGEPKGKFGGYMDKGGFVYAEGVFPFIL